MKRKKRKRTERNERKENQEKKKEKKQGKKRKETERKQGKSRKKRKKTEKRKNRRRHRSGDPSCETPSDAHGVVPRATGTKSLCLCASFLPVQWLRWCSRWGLARSTTLIWSLDSRSDCVRRSETPPDHKLFIKRGFLENEGEETIKVSVATPAKPCGEKLLYFCKFWAVKDF